VPKEDSHDLTTSDLPVSAVPMRWYYAPDLSGLGVGRERIVCAL
jgi:hypothetical protein